MSNEQIIQARITSMKTATITEHNAVAFVLEYAKVFRSVQSAATQRKLDIRYGKAVRFIQANVDLAKQVSEERRAVRLAEMQKAQEAYEHLGNCPVDGNVAYDGECACYETKLEMKGGRA